MHSYICIFKTVVHKGTKQCIYYYYWYRDKKVCGIACGGIHNAAYTESGQVYTWGCSDDGSLGRFVLSYILQ